ncbi:hypothetical protein SASPL_147262 [Salvia splendens]|uniref:DUF4218 domain-containing protein n=1 Tax=Salvia splendens TaxID=180675 RepID=A0A8X8Z6G8_SALSN|nr:hypothetical protein SASPL_147262 [Salvia splendens]
MGRLSDSIPIILCNPERIFAPSFFDSVEHLLVHLADKARLARPVQFRWRLIEDEMALDCIQSRFSKVWILWKKKGAVRFSSFVTSLKKFNVPNKARPGYVSGATWEG